MDHPNFPTNLTKQQPLANLLESLDFIKTDTGYAWKTDKLDFSITMGFFNTWFLVRGPYITSRAMYTEHEILLESNISPIEFMAKLYKLWSEVFNNQETSDPNLIWGQKWIQYQEDVKAMIPPPPTIWADREFLRFCLSHIERLHDWIDKDYEISFTQIPGQLKITANHTTVYCPARGYLLGEIVVSAKALFRHLPKRFIGDIVSLQSKGDKLLLDGRSFPARWVELNSYQLATFNSNG